MNDFKRKMIIKRALNATGIWVTIVIAWIDKEISQRPFFSFKNNEEFLTKVNALNMNKLPEMEIRGMFHED